MLQEGGPLPGPETGSCLTLGNELSEETHVLTKQEILLESALEWRAEGEGSQENCSAEWLSLGFYGDGINFRGVFSQSSDSESFLVGAGLVQPR